MMAFYASFVGCNWLKKGLKKLQNRTFLTLFMW